MNNWLKEFNKPAVKAWLVFVWWRCKNYGDSYWKQDS